MDIKKMIESQEEAARDLALIDSLKKVKTVLIREMGAAKIGKELIALSEDGENSPKKDLEEALDKRKMDYSKLRIVTLLSIHSKELGIENGIIPNPEVLPLAKEVLKLIDQFLEL